MAERCVKGRQIPPDRYGRVTTADGDGLAGVAIHYGFFCNPNPSLPIVTYTDSDGYYDVQAYCPFDHDETMSYFASLDGYQFAPELACFRTYGYCVSQSTNFIATPLN